ncbi:MAG: hypothetical protein DWQ34_10465 [Planctomycetota bacterium]|nr:MAG: hypothetical protein DWQ34_10465 [Planctomycetota bacterium]REK23072.1 MAG: hypothetical protein DWQ41_18025 [Planctomycetota bacterium]REK34088.1 MAG: hypothetical protein DWQ45_14055 [Planctomycetota bacterium]
MYDDLIALAEHIVQIDAAGRTRQAHLRRAVSTAYYAVFHYLVHEACCAQIGTQNSQRGYRHSLGRAFAHTTMKKACSSFGGGTLRESVIKGLPRDANGNYSVPREIRDIAATFTELQEKRHLADYDLSEPWRRSEVLTLIDQAKSHVERFQRLAPTDDRKFFLACLWAWKELENR